MMKEISVISYNIHGCIGVDGEYKPERIAQVLTDSKADIAGLQEVDSRRHPGTGADRQLQMIAEATGLYGIAGPAQTGDEGHYGNALLTRFPVKDIRRHNLSIQGLEPRGALDVDLDVAGATLRIVVTHLGLKGSERRKQVKRLLDSVEADPDQSLILMGDFNEWGSVRRGLGRKIDRLFGSAARIRTFPSRYPVFALDRIWVHPNSLLWQMHSIVNETTRVASDHLPLKAVIRAEVKDAKLTGAVQTPKPKRKLIWR